MTSPTSSQSSVLPVLTVLPVLVALAGCSGEPRDSEDLPEGCLVIDADLQGPGDLVWTDVEDEPELPDVCVTADVRVRGTSLTIEPGVRVHFDAGASLAIEDDSALSAVGTAEAPIVFEGASSMPGWWDGIVIRSDDVRNVVQHTVFRDAGAGDVRADDLLGFDVPAALVLDGEAAFAPTLTLDDVEFTDNEGWGLAVEGAYEGLRGGERLTFSGNVDGAVATRAENVHRFDADDAFMGNGFDGVEIAGGFPALELSGPVQWRALAGDAAYRIHGELSFASEVSIEAGATLRFTTGTGIVVLQTLEGTGPRFTVEGTADRPVVFTGESEIAGSWDGLQIRSSDVGNLIEHAVIGYADVGILADKDGAYPAAVLTVRSTEVRHSATCGVSSDNVANALTLEDMSYGKNADDVCLP